MIKEVFQLKPLGEWSLDYIEELSSSEFDWIDFKASDWLHLDNEFFDKILKYILAWSNYNGGYLLIDIPSTTPGQRPQFDGGVDLLLKNGVKDWLEAKLPGLVEEPLQKINVQTIPF